MRLGDKVVLKHSAHVGRVATVIAIKTETITTMVEGKPAAGEVSGRFTTRMIQLSIGGDFLDWVLERIYEGSVPSANHTQ